VKIREKCFKLIFLVEFMGRTKLTGANRLSLIREEGRSAKELASLYGVSTSTFYRTLRKARDEGKEISYKVRAQNRLSDVKIQGLRMDIKKGEKGATALAKEYGVSRSTVYRHINKIKAEPELELKEIEGPYKFEPSIEEEVIEKSDGVKRKPMGGWARGGLAAAIIGIAALGYDGVISDGNRLGNGVTWLDDSILGGRAGRFVDEQISPSYKKLSEEFRVVLGNK
tara:strand:- start:4864 stop:5541 length:678 start_codon:yes stop_codon:yes gene_type:complete